LTTATPTLQVSNKEFIFIIIKNKLVFRPFSNPDSDESIRAIEKAETLQYEAIVISDNLFLRAIMSPKMYYLSFQLHVVKRNLFCSFNFI